MVRRESYLARMQKAQIYSSRGLAAILILSSIAAKASPGGDQKDTTVVFTEVVAPKDSFEKLVFPAQISSKVNAKFVAQGDGIVTQINKRVGSAVNHGDTLVVLRNTDPSFSYAPLKIRAPISGIVSSLDLSVGSEVSKGQFLGSLIDPTSWKIALEVPVSDLSKIQTGEVAKFNMSGLDQALDVVVVAKAPVVDPTTGTGRVELEFSKGAASSANAKTTTNQAWVGQVGKVEFQSNARKSFLLPQDAVVYRQGKQFLRKVLSKDEKTKTAQFVEVKLGPNFGENVEISTGLSEGDEIILRASAFVADGQEVKVFVPEASPDSPNPQAR